MNQSSNPFREDLQCKYRYVSMIARTLCKHEYKYILYPSQNKQQRFARITRCGEEARA